MLKTKTLIIIISLLAMLLMIFPNITYAKSIEVDDSVKVATGVIDPDDYKPNSPTNEDANALVSRANGVIGVIRVVGVVVAVATIIIMGIKYIIGSVSERAEYKKTMIPYLIGAILFFGLTQIIGLIYDITTETLN